MLTLCSVAGFLLPTEEAFAHRAVVSMALTTFSLCGIAYAAVLIIPVANAITSSLKLWLMKIFFGGVFVFFVFLIDFFLKFQISIGQGWGRPRNGGRPRRVGTAVGHGGAPALAN